MAASKEAPPIEDGGRRGLDLHERHPEIVCNSTTHADAPAPGNARDALASDSPRDGVRRAAVGLIAAWDRYARTFASVHCDGDGATWQEWQRERGAHSDAVEALRRALACADVREG